MPRTAFHRRRWLLAPVAAGSAAVLVLGLVMVGGSAVSSAPAAAVPAAPAAGPAAVPAAPKGFALNCRFSHSDSVDPIVMPGHAGMSHLHEFFGNRTTDENTTGPDLLASTGTCEDGNDRSAYWVPALLVNAVRVQPELVRVYYISGEATVTAFPSGFKAVSGKTDQTAAWGCVVPGEPPVRSSGVAVVPTCAPGSRLFSEIVFPQCWDGKSLDSADHASHLAFPTTTPGGRQTCPRTHTVRVPQVRLFVIYPRSVTGGTSVSLASGPASSLHGDIFQAWTGTSLQTRIDAGTTLGARLRPLA